MKANSRQICCAAPYALPECFGGLKVFCSVSALEWDRSLEIAIYEGYSLASGLPAALASEIIPAWTSG